jgi:cell division protease FtsH
MKPHQKNFTLWIVIFLMLAVVAKVISEGKTNYKKIQYSEFVHAIENGHIKEVTFKGKNTIIGQFKEGYENQVRFRLTGDTGEGTFNILRKNNITPNYEEEDKQPFFTTLLVSWGPMIILIVIFWFFLRQIQAGGGKAMSFGKSKARMLNPNEKKVTFSDVSGVEEAKEELIEIVDFLKDPKKYTALGGKIPKGVILVGPPGTGKTLLARAVAGEADVPFFTISGSDFVEMFVGVGASRVRDLFEQGKKNSPCIIFIDEIDAVGRHRGSGMGGGHDEREQTLNQLLVEMDGFESNEGVILIAATNRLDVLDPALLRPGRFDRQVMVGIPDVRGRLGILKVHTQKTPLKNDVNLEIIAKGTPGFTGADLANLVNEAALTAARFNKKEVDNHDFEEAKDKVLMGPQRKSMVISDKDKRRTAFHEAGHTLVSVKLPHCDPIHKVTIIPRGGALGLTQSLPDEDKLSQTIDAAQNFIAMAMGGRVAELLVFNEISSGAAQDIEVATNLAHRMICDWGMSEALGPVRYKRNSSSPYAIASGSVMEYSEKTAREIDQEIRRILSENEKLATKLVKENRGALDRLAEALIIWETLDAGQVKKIVDNEDIGLPLPPNESPAEEKEETASEELASGEDEVEKEKDDHSDDPVMA